MQTAKPFAEHKVSSYSFHLIVVIMKFTNTMQILFQKKPFSIYFFPLQNTFLQIKNIENGVLNGKKEKSIRKYI